MDYRFVEMRCNELEAFAFVELRHQEATYQLRASRASTFEELSKSFLQTLKIF